HRCHGVGLALRADAQAIHSRCNLFGSRTGHHLLVGHAGKPDGRIDLWRDHGPALAVYRAADIGAGRRDVWHALARDADRHYFPESSDRRILWRLSWRLSL